MSFKVRGGLPVPTVRAVYSDVLRNPLTTPADVAGRLSWYFDGRTTPAARLVVDAVRQGEVYLYRRGRYAYLFCGDLAGERLASSLGLSPNEQTTATAAEIIELCRE